MVTCLSAESGLKSVSDPKSVFWIVFLIPLIEEDFRFLFLKISGAKSVAEGTWFGGIMGIVETCLKVGFQGEQIENHAFRVIASVPIHGLIGGILTRGFPFLPLVIFIHASFNIGISRNSSMGLIWSLFNVWMAGVLWVWGLCSEQESSSKTNSSVLK